MKLFCIILLSIGYSLTAYAQWANGSGLDPINNPHPVELNGNNDHRPVRIIDGSLTLGLAGKLQVQANVDNSLKNGSRLVNFVGLGMSSAEDVLRLQAAPSSTSQNPYLIRGQSGPLGGPNILTNFYIRSNGASSFNSTMNLLSANDAEHRALNIKNDEALWYNEDYFSWGFGGNWNQFADGITIGSATAPGSDNALRITDHKNIFLDGGDITLNNGDLISTGGDHIYDGGKVIMNAGDIELTTGSVVYKSDDSKRLSFENSTNIEKSFVESGPNFMRLGDLNQLLVEIDEERYFTSSKFFEANIFSKKVHFGTDAPISFGTDPNNPDAVIQLVTDDLLVLNGDPNGQIALLTNNGDVLIGNTNTNFVMKDSSIGINESDPQHTLHVNGNVGITGEFFALSDERIKTDISALQDADNVLTKLRPVTYNFINQEHDKKLFISKKGQYGLIAQEVEEVLPDLVTQHHSTTVINSEKVKLKGVNYNGLIAILIKGHQEQADQIKDYEKVIEKHEKVAEQLSNRLTELENMILKNVEQD